MSKIIDLLEKARSDKKDLLEACKQAHKEGYESGYTDGVETDGCVESNIIDQNDYAKAWNISAAKKVAIAKAKPVEVNLNSQ